MTPTQPTFTLLHETAILDRLRGLPSNSVDAIVTDGPYMLSAPPDPLALLRSWMETGHHDLFSQRGGFMGKAWDSSIPQPIQWHECLRVLKPGGHLLAFAGTRTQDIMGLSIRLGGFEIRDMLAWLYGSGFPKSHNLDRDWEGFGTALKPALEPITLARKSPDGTIESNVLKWHTGALNIDACRIGWPDGNTPTIGTPGWGGPAKKLTAVPGQESETVERTPPSILGRWPANVIHDGSPEVLAAFPVAPGAQAAVTGNEPTVNGFSGPVKFSGMIGRVASSLPRVETDTSAARFFYCAKTSKSDRNAGCDHLPDKEWAADGACVPERERRPFNPSKNNHPTVKPTALMRYLCRLITPPGGTILDPFLGSGSTGKAALLEGFDFIGIEQSLEYLAIAQARLEHAQKLAAHS